MDSRWERTRARMADMGVEALLLSVGADLPWLTGYTAMPLERLTMLVLPLDDDATLVVPALEAPRVGGSDVQTRRAGQEGTFRTVAWAETDDPIAIVARLVGVRTRLAVSDRTWARFVLALQEALPAAAWEPASTVTAPLRAVKDDDEVAALRRAGRAADVVAEQLVAGEIPLIGRCEAEVSHDIGDCLRAAGHQQVNFAIVASGPNAASPHHEPGARSIGAGEPVVCDFGGSLDGYCSDITRTVFTGAPPGEFEELYGVLQGAQAEAVEAATVGTPCAEVDGVARRAIAAAGYGEYFVHRTGHGIGLEEHEDPYLVEGNGAPLVAGNAFSVEPGIYIPGRWGARIEDIVVATDAGPESLNRAHHALTIVEA